MIIRAIVGVHVILFNNSPKSEKEKEIHSEVKN